MIKLEFSTHVKASRSMVWSGVTTFNGVNLEFFPILRMTCPDPTLRISTEYVSDKPIFRSWLLLFGILPIDYDLLRLTKVIDNECFEEKSSMALISEWNHHRYLYDGGSQQGNQKNEEDDALLSSSSEGKSNEGTLIVDTLIFQPRIPGTGFLLSIIVRALFSYRHMRLRVLYN